MHQRKMPFLELMPSICPLCYMENDYLLRIFFGCAYWLKCWFKVFSIFNMNWVFSNILNGSSFLLVLFSLQGRAFFGLMQLQHYYQIMVGEKSKNLLRRPSSLGRSFWISLFKKLFFMFSFQVICWFLFTWYCFKLACFYCFFVIVTLFLLSYHSFVKFVSFEH